MVSLSPKCHLLSQRGHPVSPNPSEPNFKLLIERNALAGTAHCPPVLALIQVIAVLACCHTLISEHSQ